MNKPIGIIFIVLGTIGIAWFGYHYMQDAHTYRFLGADVVVAEGDYAPIIASTVMLCAGLLLLKVNKWFKKS